MRREDLLAAFHDTAPGLDIEVVDSCASTNALLLARAQQGAASRLAIVAREQTAGRGRQGRAWVSAPGDSLTFSLLWRFAAGTPLSGLSLAIGVAVAEALEAFAPGAPLLLKWPNDVLRDGGKLAGILIELSGRNAAVIGVGINLRLPAALPDDVRATAAALPDGTGDVAALAAVLTAMAAVCRRFDGVGFAPWQAAFAARDAMRDRPVQLLAPPAPPRVGTARGVDADGALRLETDGAIHAVVAGELSLRPAP